MVSCTRSSASEGFPVRRSATRYRTSRWTRASRSKLARLSSRGTGDEAGGVGLDSAMVVPEGSRSPASSAMGEVAAGRAGWWSGRRRGRSARGRGGVGGTGGRGGGGGGGEAGRGGGRRGRVGGRAAARLLGDRAARRAARAVLGAELGREQR